MPMSTVNGRKYIADLTLQIKVKQAQLSSADDADRADLQAQITVLQNKIYAYEDDKDFSDLVEIFREANMPSLSPLASFKQGLQICGNLKEFLRGYGVKTQIFMVSGYKGEPNKAVQGWRDFGNASDWYSSVLHVKNAFYDLTWQQFQQHGFTNTYMQSYDNQKEVHRDWMRIDKRGM